MIDLVGGASDDLTEVSFQEPTSCQIENNRKRDILISGGTLDCVTCFQNCILT